MTRGPAAMVLDTGWSVADHVRLARELTGDHRTDLVGFGPDGVYVATAQGDSFAAPAQVVPDFGSNLGWHNATSVRTLADVNGDGKPDLVGIGPLTVRVSLGNGDGTFATSTTVWTAEFSAAAGWDPAHHALMLGDVDGDGKADLVGIDSWGVYVALSTGTSFAAKQMWLRGFSQTTGGWDATKHVRLLSDVNHDGMADIVGFYDDGVRVATSDGKRFVPRSQVVAAYGNNQGWTVAGSVRTVANLNGDGFPDLIGMGPGGVTVAIGGATGFAAPTQWSTELGDNTGWDATKHPRLIGDVDGDGVDDVVGIGDAHVYLALSTGTALTALLPVLDVFTFNAGWQVDKHPRLLADVDGDGHLDLVGFNHDAIYWDHLMPQVPALPSDWDRPACAASRLGPPAPRACEGPWQYTEATRCVGNDASCPTACTSYQSCAKWENGATHTGATTESVPGVIGPDTRSCDQLCNNVGCNPASCSGGITPPTAQCQTSANNRAADLRTQAANAVMAESTFDSAAAQSLRVTDAQNQVSVTSSTPIIQTNRHSQPGPGGTFKTWDEHYGCSITVVSALPVTAANDACTCQTTAQTACEHTCGSTVKFTAPGLLEPASPNISGQVCLTHDDLPQTTQGEIRSKFEVLWSAFQGTPPPSVVAETFQRAIVTRLKLMYELFGDKLLDEHSQTDQVHRAIGLYKDRPDENPSCMLDIDAPATPTACTNAAVAGTHGDLIRCQRLLGTHASEGTASLASLDCTSLLTGYLGLKTGSDDATCGGPHLRELGASTLFKLEDKQLGVINSAPTTLGTLQRQLWLFDSWYTTSKAAEAAGVFPAADQQRRDTSFLLGELWTRVRGNTSADTVLRDLSQSATPDQAEAALGLSAAASRGVEQSVVSAAFTPVATIQPENVTLNRVPLRGLPLLALVGDAFKPLVDDLDGLAIFHDMACQFKDCRAPVTDTPSRAAWKLLAHLEASTLTNDVTQNTHSLVGWNPVFGKLAAQQPAFLAAIGTAVSGDGGLAGAAAEADVHPLARPLWVLYKHARAFQAHYEATGLFEASAQPQLHGSVLQQDQHTVVSGLRTQANELTGKVNDYRTGLIAALKAEIDVMDAGAQLQNLATQRLRKATEMDQKAKNAEGLRASGEDEDSAFGSLTASFADIQQALDTGALVQIGDTASLTLTAADSKFTNVVQPDLLSVHTIPNLAAGQVLLVQASGLWSPTCALSDATFLGAGGEDPLTVGNLDKAVAGPEGFSITDSGGTVEAHSSGHAFGFEAEMGQSAKFCSTPGLIGEAIGVKLEECVFASDKVSFSTSTSDNGGNEARSSAAFSTGLRLPHTPYPEAPVGSLLVVLTNSTTGAIRDIRVVHTGATSIVIPGASKAYFIVNDRHCGTAGTQDSITVGIRTMASQVAVAEKALASMVEVLSYLQLQQQLLVDQGTLLPDQATEFRHQANLKLQAKLGEIDVQSLPSPLASLFDAFVNHQIVAIERKIEIRAIERALDLDLIDLRTIDDEITAGTARARLQHLVPQWLIRDLDHDSLRNNLVQLLSVTRDNLAPILDLWYPGALASVANSPEIATLLNSDLDTSLITLASHGVQFVNSALDAYDIATFGAKPPGATLPVVVLSFPRPGVTPSTNTTWRQVDDVRARRVWDAVDGRKLGEFEVRPEDFYSSNGGTSILSCAEVVPVIRNMAAYLVRPGAIDNGTLNGFGMTFHGFAGVSQSFVLPEGPRIYELADSAWQQFDTPLLYGENEDARTTFLNSPHQTRPLGLSAAGTFDLDFSGINALPNHGHLDHGDSQPVTEIVLVMELDSRAVGSGPSWVSTCAPHS